MMLTASAPGVVHSPSRDDGLLRDTSFRYFVGIIRPETVERRWLHVSVDEPPSGDIQQEEAFAVDIARRELIKNGCSISTERIQVLHIRELWHDAKSPDEVQKSKIFLVLVGPNLLVSVCDGKSFSIPQCKRSFAGRDDMTPIEVAAEIIGEALRPVRGVRMAFTRFIQPLSEYARRDLLDETQQTSLDKIKRASGYATMRLLDMQSGAVRQLIDFIDHSGLQTTHQTSRAALVRLGGMLGVEATAFQKIDALIGDVRSAHRENLSRRLVEETEKNNQLQKEAEHRKQRTDAQWQILGGISVPIGFALGAIQAFQLSHEVGAVVVALSLAVSAGLVYFRNDWFGWLYGPNAQDRDSKPIESTKLAASDCKSPSVSLKTSSPRETNARHHDTPEHL